MDTWAGAPRRAGGGEARGLPMTPAEAHLAHTGGGGDSHLPPRSRRSPRRHHPLLPPPRPRTARTSSPDGGTGTAAGGTHAETAWGASLTDSAASVPPTHTRVLTTSRWQPAPQPADTPPTPLAPCPPRRPCPPPHPPPLPRPATQTPSPAGGGHNHLRATRARGEAPCRTGGRAGGRRGRREAARGKGPVARGTVARRGKDEEREGGVGGQWATICT